MAYDVLWYNISFLGDAFVWAGIAVALVLVYLIFRHSGRKNESLKLFLLILIPSLAISMGATQVLKITLDVPRPCMPCTGYLEPPLCNPYCLLDPGFPSGHTAVVFTALAALYLAFRKKEMLLFLVVAAAVAVSRIMLGIHSMQDVAGGALLGIVAVFVWNNWILAWWKERKKPKTLAAKFLEK
jgi:membrane-associated phospholipid phosphatase